MHNKHDEMLKNLKQHFPYTYDNIIASRVHSQYELIVKTDDGLVFLYDDIDKTTRRLPVNSCDMDEHETKREFGMRLQKLIYRSGLTQGELSEMTGINKGQISSYISGRTSPSFYKVDRLAKALKCSMDDLRYYDYEDWRDE